MRTPTKTVLFIAILAAVLLGIFWLTLPESSRDKSTSSTSSTPEIEERRRSVAALDNTFGSQQNRTVEGTGIETSPTLEGDSNTSAPLQPDPNEREFNAKIGYVIDDFRGFHKSLDGYTLEGLKRTEEGLTLDDDSETSITAAGAILGVLQSPTLPLSFPSNAVQPIWRAKSPEDGSIHVELSLSPDQENWSHWYPSEPTGDDISPTYPDGRPNPNYGAISGGAIANGLKLLPYVRYRVTLTAHGDKRPVLQEFKITHLDTTEGQGQLATEPPGVSAPTSEAPVSTPAATPTNQAP